jgi:hypothetical protein
MDMHMLFSNLAVPKKSVDDASCTNVANSVVVASARGILIFEHFAVHCRGSDECLPSYLLGFVGSPNDR